MKYEVVLECAFFTIWSQLDKTTKIKLKSQLEWTDIDDNNDTIKMLLILCKLCNQQHQVKIFPLIKVIRSNRKVLTHRRYKGESDTDYHKHLYTLMEICKAQELNMKDEALKVLLGDDNHMLEEHNNDNTHLTNTKKAQYNLKARELIAAILLIEGNGTQKENPVGKMLHGRFLLGSEEYPCTPCQAMDLIGEFNKTKGGGDNQAQAQKGQGNGNQQGDQKSLSNNNNYDGNNRNQESTNFTTKGE